jgi:excisionase family DNA binding protein
MKIDLKDLSLINRQLAESIGVPLSTIDRAAQNGRLPTYRIGTNEETRVVRISELVKWMNESYRPQNTE